MLASNSQVLSFSIIFIPVHEDYSLSLSTAFRSKISNTFGDQGQQWLKQLPELIKQCEKQHAIKIEKVLDDLSYNYVANAIDDSGQPLIIKIGVVNTGFSNEIDALTAMAGSGVVKLIHADKTLGMMLLEKLIPGKTLATVTNDNEATTIACSLMQQIVQAVPENHEFKTTQDWFKRFDKKVDSSYISTKLIDKAQVIARELHQSISKYMLLHGDLHHFNILSAQREPWLAIDPKGVIGEHEFEVSALMRNPIPDIVTAMKTKAVLKNRADIICEQLRFDRQKVLAWAFTTTVLASVWRYDEDPKQDNYFYHCAEVLNELS